MHSMLGLIFAYRSFDGLQALAQPRTAASLPFGGRYRAIDFCLSNMVGAGITNVGVVMRDSYQSLMDHLGSGKDWDLSRNNGGLILLPPNSYGGRSGSYFSGSFRGKLDGLMGIASYIERSREEYVVMADGDCIVNIRLADVLRSHLSSGADITAVCTDSPCGRPEDSVYFRLDTTGRVCGIDSRMEQPQKNESLGIFILKKDLLMRLIAQGRTADESHFERGILRRVLPLYKVLPYHHTGYAARNQTVAMYFANTMKLLDTSVRAELFTPSNPIRTRIRDDAPAFYADGSCVRNSLITEGCRIEGRVENSVLFRNVHVAPNAVVRNSIILQEGIIESGVDLDYVITDKRVLICSGKTLTGDAQYPMVIEKNAVVR